MDAVLLLLLSYLSQGIQTLDALGRVERERDPWQRPSDLLANHIGIAILALCILGMAFVFRIVIFVLVNRVSRINRRTAGLTVQHWFLPIRLERNAAKGKVRKVSDSGLR